MKRNNIFQCWFRRSLMHLQRIETVMAEKKMPEAVILITLAMALCCACSESTNAKQNRMQMIDSYCQTIGEDAGAYFAELSEEACGIRPERIYYSITEDTSDEILAQKPLTWQEMLETGNPRLIVGLHKKTEVRDDADAYTEQEVRQVLKEALNRGIILNIYFDNEHLIYQINQDGKIIAVENSGADGGAYRNTYELDVTGKHQ